MAASYALTADETSRSASHDLRCENRSLRLSPTAANDIATAHNLACDLGERYMGTSDSSARPLQRLR